MSNDGKDISGTIEMVLGVVIGAVGSHFLGFWIGIGAALLVVFVLDLLDRMVGRE
jgi:uncharacterized membrane protein YgaE (UPF0421/DUF939 family)